jgi:universal stress protein A
MYKTIIHATDLSANHYTLCEKARDIATLFNAKLYLIHVIEVPTSFQIAQTLGFAELINPYKKAAVDVMNALGESIGVAPEQQCVEVGSVKYKVLEFSQKLGANLIIIGAHTGHELKDWLGSSAQAITHGANCDILTLK